GPPQRDRGVADREADACRSRLEVAAENRRAEAAALHAGQDPIELLHSGLVLDVQTEFVQGSETKRVFLEALSPDPTREPHAVGHTLGADGVVPVIAHAEERAAVDVELHREIAQDAPPFRLEERARREGPAVFVEQMSPRLL